MRRILSGVVLVVAAAAAGVAVPARTPAAATPAGEAARADFDDDGFADLAVGVPDEDVEARGAAGRWSSSTAPRPA